MTLRLTRAEMARLQSLADRWSVNVGEALRQCFVKVATEERK
jgi:hypothetical protein